MLFTLQQSNETGTWLQVCDYIHPILKYVFSTTGLSGTYTVLKSMCKCFPRPNQSLCLKKDILLSLWPYNMLSFMESKIKQHDHMEKKHKKKQLVSVFMLLY